MQNPKKRLAVIGAGTAGIVSLCYFCANLTNDWEIVSVYDPDTPILGIGESTNASFIRILEQGTRFSMYEDLDHLDGTLKFGSQFINWRDQDWLNPLINGSVAVHFNNFKLKEFAFSRLPKIWPDKFRVSEGKVLDIQNNPDRVVLTINDRIEEFDYIIDCRGFPKDFSEYHISHCSKVNHCLVHNFDRLDTHQSTEHIATKNGWMFGIPLQSRKTYGYLFNDQITTIEDAKSDMADILNININELDNIEYKFRPYYAKRLIENRITKNGNAALFFEPISATSINQYSSTCQIIHEYIVGQISEDVANNKFIHDSNVTEDIFNYYYHGGSTFDTEFWRQAAENAKKNLSDNARFKFMIEMSKQATRVGLPYHGPAHLFSAYSLAIIDEAFGYNYFKGAPFLFEDPFLNDWTED